MKTVRDVLNYRILQAQLARDKSGIEDKAYYDRLIVSYVSLLEQGADMDWTRFMQIAKEVTKTI
jgi:hypothetical protein